MGSACRRTSQLRPAGRGPRAQLSHLDQHLAEQKNPWLEKPEVVEWLTALLAKIKADGRSRP